MCKVVKSFLYIKEYCRRDKAESLKTVVQNEEAYYMRVQLSTSPENQTGADEKTSSRPGY